MEINKKIQIECGLGAKFGSNYVQCCEKIKTGNIIRLFSCFTRGLPFKARGRVKPPEWKFTAIIARNVKF